MKADASPGRRGEIGSFGGLFDLRPPGSADPILVAQMTASAPKSSCVETRIHDSVGIDLVAMCVNDLVVQGAEMLFFLDYYRHRQARPAGSAPLSPACRRLSPGRVRLHRRRDTECPGLLCPGTILRPCRLCRGRPLTPGALLPRDDVAEGRCNPRSRFVPRDFQRLPLWRE